MRVVLDVNVLISFLLSGGSTISKILDGWKEKKFTLLVSQEILLEVGQVLDRFVTAKMIKDLEASALFQRLQVDAQVIKTFSQVNASSNKKDNRYLACAKDGNADYLVTGDKKHLLVLGKFGRTKIVSPKEFTRILGD